MPGPAGPGADAQYCAGVSWRPRPCSDAAECRRTPHPAAGAPQRPLSPTVPEPALPAASPQPHSMLPSTLLSRGEPARPPPPAGRAVGRLQDWRRWGPWAALGLLLVVAQSALLWLTAAYESGRAQDQVESSAAEASAATRRELLRVQQALQALQPADHADAGWAEAARRLLPAHRELRHLERRDGAFSVTAWAASPFGPPLFDQLARAQVGVEAEAACRAAAASGAPVASRSYYVPRASGLGEEVIDLCLPARATGDEVGFMVGTVALAPLLETVLAGLPQRGYELSLVEGDGARLARAGAARGRGIFVATQPVPLPGQTLLLRADSTAGRPGLVPNLAVSLVLGLSLALAGLVWLLVRDARRRAAAEAALAEAYGFRKAMEDSLSTGLRARDLDGAVTYANPAFCAMVGFTLEELRAARPPTPAPYWPPEHVADYAARQAARLAGRGRAPGEPREGFETVFVRRSGERFPVMIYEAPLRDRQGAQTGWMSAVVDLSDQRRVEELSRQQQERLQATARLASVGEMASLLSHELTQPLAAIASYAHGSLNLLEGGAAREAGGNEGTPGLLRHSLDRIAAQAERAGRVIRSVHDFVRRREQPREVVPPALLVEAVLPLVRMQARKSGARIDIAIPEAAPRVHCDRTMVEQVLLNLARNGIQAMEQDTPPGARVLTIAVGPAGPAQLRFAVSDAGPGIAPEVAARLFTPFFTTRAEGMGLGLSLCRTVIEQHGGRLDFAPGPLGRGTTFAFTLPVAAADATGEVLPGRPVRSGAVGEDDNRGDAGP